MEIYGFILSAVDLWLLGICGALIMALIGYRFALNISEQKEIKDTAVNFVNVFEVIKATILQNPDLSDKQIVDDILKQNYPEQRIAMKSLYRRLGYIKKRAFSEAWQKYEDPENCGGEPFLRYSGVPWEIDKKPFDRQYILQAIEHLLSFAKLK